jgi:hypothetical protein
VESPRTHSGTPSFPGLSWADSPNLIPRIFREQRFTATSGGTWLHATTERGDHEEARTCWSARVRAVHGGRPQQDSNLRTRLRRPPSQSSEFVPPTWPYAVGISVRMLDHSAHIPDHGSS